MIKIFAYGSLKEDYESNIEYTLQGYNRVLNAVTGDGYVYYNLVRGIGHVTGVILQLDPDQLYEVIQREKGYSMISLQDPNIGDFYTFISERTIPVTKKTYIDKSK